MFGALLETLPLKHEITSSSRRPLTQTRGAGYCTGVRVRKYGSAVWRGGSQRARASEVGCFMGPKMSSGLPHHRRPLPDALSCPCLFLPFLRAFLLLSVPAGDICLTVRLPWELSIPIVSAESCRLHGTAQRLSSYVGSFLPQSPYRSLDLDFPTYLTLVPSLKR